jgi:hypothetical protein
MRTLLSLLCISFRTCLQASIHKYQQKRDLGICVFYSNSGTPIAQFRLSQFESSICKIMERRSNMKKTVLILLMLMWAGISHAEDLHKAELFGGFSYARGFPYDVNMYGWNASLAGAINREVAIVGDFSGNYADLGYGSHFRMHSIAGGPQFSFGHGRITPFVRILIGMNRVSYGDRSDTNLSTILGAGFDVAVNKRLAIRALQADWMHVFHGRRGQTYGSNENINIGRISSGIVIRF